MIPELKSSRSENNQNKCGVTCFQVVPGEKQIDWKISFKLKKREEEKGMKVDEEKGWKVDEEKVWKRAGEGTYRERGGSQKQRRNSEKQRRNYKTEKEL